MQKIADAELFDKLLNAATDIANDKGHRVVEPFHILVAIVRDAKARKFFEGLDFPFEKMKTITEDLAREYVPVTLSCEKNPKTKALTDNIHQMRKSSQKIAAGLERDYVGYMEIINSIVDLGDDDSRYCLTHHNLALEDKLAVTRYLLEDKAEWKPSRRQKKANTQLQTSFSDAANDNADILNMDKIMQQRIIGQTDAINALHKSQKRALAGLKEANKPIGSYLFAGPTSVGKTEVAKQLAAIRNIPLVRFDMSEYMEDYNVSNLTGSAAGLIGYDKGGLLTNAVSENPRCVLLLDEVEKAHPDIFNILLQVLDEGHLTDNQGNTVDFKNVTIVMTTNAGVIDLSSKTAAQGIGFVHPNEEDQANDQKSASQEAINKFFRPEFRNRLDGIITFDYLTKENVMEITDLFIDEMNDLPAAHDHNLTFKATAEAIAAIVEASYDKAMGARPVKRYIDNEIKDRLADMILAGELTNQQITITRSKDDNTIVFETAPQEEKKANAEMAANHDAATAANPLEPGL